MESTLVDNAKKLQFTYDYMGRSIQKQVYAWDAASDLWSLTSDLRYVYDSWNLIEVLDATDSNSVAKTYTWGLDLSQSLQGAGGVGGLLAVTEHGETADTPYYTTYDANGNISEYLDNTGSVAVHYEYSPFGRLTLVDSETGAPDFNHRFSTKYRDVETGLYYYGRRYYSSELGRWVSRDPIQEHGGLNLHGFVSNNPGNVIELLGLASLTAVKKGHLFYTWHMGWIDKSHCGYEKKKQSIVDSWKKVKRASIGDVVDVTFDIRQDGGRGVTRCYCIEVDSDRKEQFIWAYMDASEAFESEQGRFPQNIGWVNKLYGRLVKGEEDKVPSSFSTEDLVSDLVLFYSIVDDTSAKTLLNKHAGRIQSIETEFSVLVWKHLHKVESGYEKWTPDYIPQKKIEGVLESPQRGLGPAALDQYHLKDYLRQYRSRFGEAPKFPDYFQNYSPQSKGVSVCDCEE